MMSRKKNCESQRWPTTEFRGAVAGTLWISPLLASDCLCCRPCQGTGTTCVPSPWSTTVP
jgi:hypothetical protein